MKGVTPSFARPRLVLLQGGQGLGMPSPDPSTDASTDPSTDPSAGTTRLCVIHGCERQGDHERQVRLGSEDVVVRVCAWHVAAKAVEQTPQPQTGA